uniref:Dynein light chain n=1 Tax=Clastoptera arizonana TaxID=38151 RepID=A0A1B6DBX8_9HEMI
MSGGRQESISTVDKHEKKSFTMETNRPTLECESLHDVLSNLISIDSIKSSDNTDVTQTTKNKIEAPTFMNTYCLESKKPFDVEIVEKLLKEVLTRQFDGAVYEPATVMDTCVAVSEEIKSRLTKFDFERYKIVCLVSIIENQMQSVETKVQCLWDSERDRYATFTLKNNHIISMATVFGIYYE